MFKAAAHIVHPVVRSVHRNGVNTDIFSKNFAIKGKTTANTDEKSNAGRKMNFVLEFSMLSFWIPPHWKWKPMHWKIRFKVQKKKKKGHFLRHPFHFENAIKRFCELVLQEMHRLESSSDKRGFESKFDGGICRFFFPEQSAVVSDSAAGIFVLPLNNTNNKTNQNLHLYIRIIFHPYWCRKGHHFPMNRIKKRRFFTSRQHQIYRLCQKKVCQSSDFCANMAPLRKI